MPQPTNQLNAIPALPAMTWRGIVSPPYDMASPSGGHMQAERRFPYIDGASHDNVGRDPFQMQFKLYFLNSLRDGLFPSLYEEWKNAYILDGSADDLMHPLFGKVRARPTTWSVELSAERTSGIVMDVSFIETFDDMPPAEAIAALTMSLTELAAAADKGLAKLGYEWPTGERTDSLADLLKQVQSLAFSARLTYTGMMNQAIGTVDRIVDDVDKMTDWDKWSTTNNLMELRNGMVDLGQKFASQARKMKEQVVAIATTLDSMADGHTSVNDLIALNPTLVGQPTVPAGTSVKLFAE